MSEPLFKIIMFGILIVGIALIAVLALLGAVPSASEVLQ